VTSSLFSTWYSSSVCPDSLSNVTAWIVRKLGLSIGVGREVGESLETVKKLGLSEEAARMLVGWFPAKL